MSVLAPPLTALCCALMLILGPAAPTFTRDGPIVDLFDIDEPITAANPVEACPWVGPNAAG